MSVISFIISTQFSDSYLTKIDTIYIVTIVLLVNECIKSIITDHKKMDIVYNKEFFKYAGEILGYGILIIVQILLVIFCFYYAYNRYMRG